MQASTQYIPKIYTTAEQEQLKAQWAAIEAEYRRSGTLPQGVATMGTLFGMGLAGDARPAFPVIAEIDGVPHTAVLEQLEPAVRWAVDMTFRAVEELQLPAHKAGGARVLATHAGQIAEVGANEIERFNPFKHTHIIAITPQQGG